MAQVVAVHGIFHQYGSRPSMCQDWVPHLLGGMDNATGRRDLLTEADVECCFYGGVFRPPGQRLSFGVPAYAADDITDPLEQDLHLRWWEAAAAVDPAVVPPDAQTLSTRSLIQRALLALASFRPFAMYAERHLISFLKQVTTYLTNAETRATIQQSFADVIRSDTRVVVAHSLGSVVAYEGLCAHPEWGIHSLVTLGSPLGVPNLIFVRLQPPPSVGPQTRGQWPSQLKAWTNVADSNDIVALVKKLSACFDSDIADYQIDNGLRVHGVEHYLTARETGIAIVAGLTLDA